MTNLEATSAALLKPQSVFLNRNFLLLFFGKIISQLGDHIYAFALSWYVLDLTKSSFQMAMFLVIDTLVVSAISPFGGVIADRLNRKGIMVWMDVIRGLVVLLVAFLFSMNLLQIWILYVSAILLGFCGAVFAPASGAIIPNIVEDEQLTEAMSANQFSMSFCTMIGLLISGLLYTWLGIFTIFLFNAISYFISGVMEAAVNIPLIERNNFNKPASVYQQLHKGYMEIRAGYQYIKGNQAVYYLLLMNTMFNLLGLPIVLIYTPYIFNVLLKATPFQLALPQAAIWVGMILGSFLTSIILHRQKLKHLIFWGFLTLSIFTLIGVPMLVPAVRSYFNLDNWGVSIFWTIVNTVCGLAVSFFTIPMYVIYQKRIADEYRGRFWGLENALRTAAICSGYFMAGFLAQKVWVGFLFGGTAIALFVINVWATNVKAIRELKD